MATVTFQQTVERMPRENRFRATVYAMNTLLQQKGVYSPDEFEKHFIEWDRREERSKKRTDRDGEVILGHKTILDAVARHFQTTREVILRKTNRKSSVLPRMVLMYLMHALRDQPFAEIAHQLSMHHTTVIYGVRTIEERRKSDGNMDRMLTELFEELS